MIAQERFDLCGRQPWSHRPPPQVRLEDSTSLGNDVRTREIIVSGRCPCCPEISLVGDMCPCCDSHWELRSDPMPELGSRWWRAYQDTRSHRVIWGL